MLWEKEKKTLKLNASECIPVVLSASKAMPTLQSIQDILERLDSVEQRGYFLPDEDERLREVYSQYLAVRSSLFECIYAISGQHLSVKNATTRLPDFIVAYAAACLLVRSASFIVKMATKHPVSREKLDEPEPRYNLEAKNFTRIYRSLTSPRKWWAFYDAARFFQIHRDEILGYAKNESLKPIVDLLIQEEAYVLSRRQNFLKQRLSYRIHSFLRRNHLGYKKMMFGLFKTSGSIIASLKQPFVKPSGMGKRVTTKVRERLERFLQPGDVLVTRHDDALSNLFLPGFWPHAACYIGSNEQRKKIGVRCDFKIEETVRFIEAKKDGVKLRPAEDTLQVDALVVLRPKLSEELRAAAISSGLKHTGKHYDFVFDFSKSDRLACTELIYRSYHGVSSIKFELESRAGRYCLSAEDLINQSVGKGWFDPILIYGVEGNNWIEGENSRTLLKQSFAATF